MTEKDMSEFRYKTGDKIYGYCKPCRLVRNRKYDQNRRNTDAEKIRRIMSSRRRDQREASKRWRDNNPDYAEKQRRYRENNKLKFLVGRSNQRARKQKYSGLLRSKDWEFILSLFDYKCAADKTHEITKDNPITVDHVVPLKDGGLNCIHNIQPLCLRCNMKKGKREVDFRTTDIVGSINEEYPECSVAKGRDRCRNAFEIRNKILVGFPEWEEDSQ